MQKKLEKNAKWLCTTLLVLFLFNACFEPQEGCLDPEAFNFDFSADKDGSCTYPSLSLEFAYRQTAGSSDRFSEGLLTGVGLDSFFFNQATFALTKPLLINSTTGDSLGATSDSEFYILENGQPTLSTLENQIAIIDGSRFVFSFGTFRRNLEDYDQLVFDVGFSPTQASIVPDSLSTSDNLSNYTDILYNEAEERWQDAFFEITSDTTAARDTIQARFDLEGISPIRIPFNTRQTVRGENILVELRVNFVDMLAGLPAKTPQALENTIRANLASSIEVISE